MRLKQLAMSFVALVPFIAAAQYPAIPKSTVIIKGSSYGDGAAANYTAYQEPGQTFRIVCPEPCPVNEQVIYAFNAGFKPAKAQLVSFMGIDSIPSQQPFDIHIGNDPWCGNFGVGFTGEAGSYPPYAVAKGSFGCFWYANRTDFFLPFTPENVSTVNYHLLTVHEYGHTIYYGFHSASYEDVVKAASFYVTGIGSTPPITYPCDDYLNDVSQGKLLNALCRLNGMTYPQFAASQQALRALFDSGQYDHSQGTTTIAQHHQTLNAVLGSDTMDAFLAAKFSDPKTGDSRVITPAGGRVNLLGGIVSFGVPAGAVAVNTTVTEDAAYTVPSKDNLTFLNIYVLTPAQTTFAKPVELAIKYDTSLQVAGVPESTLRLFRIDAGKWVEVPGSRPDPNRGVVRATVTTLGTYGIFGTQATDALPARIVPVVASAPGAGGSFFKTAVQIRNRGSHAISGRFVFHPQGQVGVAGDPSLNYALQPYEAKSYADLVGAMAQSGLGSLDVVTDSGSTAPEVLARVFNDGGSNGTSGFAVDAEKSSAALAVGDTGVLLLPTSLAAQRFNIGVRSLASGLTLNVTVRNAAGTMLSSTSRTYMANYFEQIPVSSFAPGVTFTGNETLHVTVTGGSGFVYGASTDNRTQDPSVQLARALSLSKLVPGDTVYIPAAASSPGAFNSFFRTEVQVTNPTAASVSGRFVFHPAGASAAVGDPMVAYTLAPYETKSTADLPAALGVSGLGSVDVVSVTGAPPLVLARIYNDQGAAGTSGLTQAGVEPVSVLQAGDFALLLVPPDLNAQRMNIGIRTLDRGAALSLRVRNAAGTRFVKRFTRTFPPNYFQQTTAASFLGDQPLTGGETIEIYVDGGQAMIYGANSDNITSDPSIQTARKLPYFE